MAMTPQQRAQRGIAANDAAGAQRAVSGGNPTAPPPVPSQHAELIASALHDVDLSGGASIAPDAELGDPALNKTRAFGAGFTPDTRSPAGRAQGATLLETYSRHLAAIRAAKATEPSPADVEKRAHKKGMLKAGKALGKGQPRDQALAKGFVRYKEEGGKLALRSWIAKCAR